MSTNPSEFLTPSFIGGWTAVLAVAGVAGYQYYTQSRPATTKAKTTTPNAAPRKQNRAKKQRQEAFTSSAQKAQAEVVPAEAPASSSQTKKAPKDEPDNKAFAAQMASVQEGKKFASKTGGEKKQKQKSVKQSRAAESPEVTAVEEKPFNEVAAEEVEVEAEADAEEHGSPTVSAESAAVDTTGVNDMLEAAPAGPSVLRLTDTDKAKTKPKVAKAPEKVETKKQRQNRKKAEERKFAREEDEKERKVLMEKQRRTAREAAGVAAKDGSQFMAAVNGGKSAWNAGSPAGPGKKEPLPVQPLDTFEDTTTNGTAASIAPAKPKADEWISTLPSEEDQIEMLKDEDEWNTVPTKTSKKGKKPQQTEMPSAPAQEARPLPQPITKTVPTTNGSSSKSASGYGSFSALTVKGGNNADDEEQEWDV